MLCHCCVAIAVLCHNDHTVLCSTMQRLQESWAAAIKTERSEPSIKAHLEGRLKALKPITGEGVYNKLAADIRTVRTGKEREGGREGRM